MPRRRGSSLRQTTTLRRPMLHPDARALIDLIAERSLPRDAHADAGRRARLLPRPPRFTQPRRARGRRACATLSCEGPHGAIPLRIYRPLGAGATRRAAALLPVLVYYHGGGWTIGDLDTHDALCRELCNGSGARRRRGRLPHGARSTASRPRSTTASPRRAGCGAQARRARRRPGAARGRRRQRRRQPRGSRRDPGARCRRPADRLPAAHLSGDRHAARATRRTRPTGSGYVLTTETITYYHDHYIADPAHDLDWRASPLLHARPARPAAGARC